MIKNKSKPIALQLLLLFFSLISLNYFHSCMYPGNQRVVESETIIFDTDMGNDIDDALALDILFKYQDENRINLLGIMLNKDYVYAPTFVDIMCNWYGYPWIPIGVFTHADTLSAAGYNFTTHVCNMKNEESQFIFERTITDYNKLPKAYDLYRKLLSDQPDTSVTIISVGFMTNLALLMDTQADQYSPLTGKELVARKVKLLSIMAGSFTEEPYAEWNILIDKLSATRVFAEWPSKIVVSPFELGDAIHYPGESIEHDFTWADYHPVVEGYKAFSQMPYNRSIWDLTSVLYAVEGESVFFNLSTKGDININEYGYTHFIADENGKHQYLTATTEQQKAILNQVVNMITKRPQKY